MYFFCFVYFSPMAFYSRDHVVGLAGNPVPLHLVPRTGGAFVAFWAVAYHTRMFLFLVCIV